MKKITVGYLFNEPNLKKEDKIFVNLAKKKNIDLIPINTGKYLRDEDFENIIKQCDIFFNNGGDIFSQELSKQIEELGKRVVESSDKYYYDDDKWMFFVKCNKHKIPTPKTVLLAENINMAKREIVDFNSWPVVLKRIEGTWGQFVGRAKNLAEAEKILKKFWGNDVDKLPIIAQEYINSESYRVTAIDGKIVQTAQKPRSGWKASGVYGNNFKRFKVDKELKEIIKKINKVFGIKVCGIDLFRRDGKWLLCEINSQPGLDFFEEDREMLIGKILDFLKKQVR